MIISLRGTSGSGKSTLVRAVTDKYLRHRDWHTDGRKKPLYTVHGRNRRGNCLVTPGHYEIANGGMDTLKTLEEAYQIAKWANAQAFDVLMEGKNMSDGYTFYNTQSEMFKQDVRIVHIDIPVETAIASVRLRGHSISEDSIRKTDAKVRRDMEKFTCKTFRGNREACLGKVLEWLGLD